MVSGLSPAFAPANGPAFTLTVDGDQFGPGSTVYWGGMALTTQFVNASQLTAAIPASSLTTAGIAAVTVQATAPGGGSANVFQFQIDSAGAMSAPVFAATSATVAAGSTASYKVTLPSTAMNVSASCLNLPTAATCSYSGANGDLTIATSATTPAGTYQVTVVFTEMEPAATGLAILPMVLLPFLFVREKAKRAWRPLLTGMILLIATVFLVSCGGKSVSMPTPPSNPTQPVTSSGVVTLTIQ